MDVFRGVHVAGLAGSGARDTPPVPLVGKVVL
jgi:hypothetical protein